MDADGNHRISFEEFLQAHADYIVEDSSEVVEHRFDTQQGVHQNTIQNSNTSSLPSHTTNQKTSDAVLLLHDSDQALVTQSAASSENNRPEPLAQPMQADDEAQPSSSDPLESSILQIDDLLGSMHKISERLDELSRVPST
mmetsp:Transcript_42863/g.67211  ORF Transcript_42863/g.67211 Transcript_42863/m.67211 type:complete len:141 (-) Transcript_42863:971-1393(-)